MRAARSTRPVLGWIRQAGLAAATALGLLAVSETVARLARWLHAPGPGWGLAHRIGPDAYEAFVGASIGAFAVLLALFFTTLGVVAAYAYADVPEELRAVFLRARENTAYVNSMVRALVFGAALLAAHSVGYHPYALSVVVFALLTLVVLLGSAALGRGLFSFFDVATLAAPLPERFTAAARSAAVSPAGSPPADRGRGEHEDARAALRLLRDVLGLATERGGARMIPSDALTTTLDTWADYARRKPAIPTDSPWFSRSRQETNWLTLNPFELQDPLTPASVPPSSAPDLTWVERELAEHYVIVLRPLVRGGDWPTVVDTLEPTGALAGGLVAHLQVREALLLCRALGAVVDPAIADRDPSLAPGGAPDQERRRRTRTAAVSAGLAVRGRMWVGLSIAADRVRDEQVGDRLEHAAHAPNDPAVADGLPVSRDLRALLDTLAAGLAIEREAEGTQISPGWWLRHHVARTLTRSLYTTADLLLEDLHAYLHTRYAAITALDDPEAMATFLLAALNTVRTAQTALDRVRLGAEQLSTLRHDEVGDESWPSWDPDESALATRRTEFLLALAAAARRLSARPHQADEPDLFGRTYLVIADALYDAVMDGDDATATALFPAVMNTALRAHQRAAIDVGDQPDINHLIHTTAPLVDIMLVSGYALFLDAFDSRGIWPSVRAEWDGATAEPELARVLAAILESRHRQVSADMRRDRWRQRFDRWLNENGLAAPHPFGPTHLGAAPVHASPVVAAVLDQGPLTTYLMADLFLLEYLTTRPGGTDRQPGRDLRTLRDALAEARSSAPEQEALRD